MYKCSVCISRALILPHALIISACGCEATPLSSELGDIGSPYALVCEARRIQDAPSVLPDRRRRRVVHDTRASRQGDVL